MRYARARKVETRQRLVQAALRAFRDKGFEGTGISGLMAEIGLTHGGFYAHFTSKAALMAEAADQGVAARTAGWRTLAAATPAPARAALLIDRYLSEAHLDDRAEGCVLAALAGDIARQPPRVRQRFTRRFQELVDVVAADITPPTPEPSTALVLLGGLVGAMILARAVDDRRLSRAMLDSMKRGLRHLLQDPAPAARRARSAARRPARPPGAAPDASRGRRR